VRLATNPSAPCFLCGTPTTLIWNVADKPICVPCERELELDEAISNRLEMLGEARANSI